LIPSLGPAGAARLQGRLTERAAAVVAGLPPGIGREIWYAGGNADRMRAWLGEEFSYHRQPAGDLGHRLLTACRSAQARGAGKIVVIGADCPTLTGADILHAFALLDEHALVLGPAVDGGYYLIGLGVIHPELFRDIPWGTDRVLAATVATARRLGLSLARLAAKADIDRPADLAAVLP